jgi:hypothetical protein
VRIKLSFVLTRVSGTIVPALLALCLNLNYGLAFPESSEETGNRAESVTDSETKAVDSESPTAVPTEEKEQVAYPNFHNTRYVEDWTVLRDSVWDSAYESIKFIPLNDSGNVSLGLGGQIRLRGEAWWDYGFGGPGNRNDTFGISRVRVHGDLRVGKRFRAFVEGKSSLATNRDLPGGLRTLDVDTIDLQNALIDVNAALDPVGLTFRLGRQELQFGNQRLVSPLNWSNTRRTWDAARAVVNHKGVQFDGFWSRFAPVKKYEFNSSHDSGIDLYGVYATGKLSSLLFMDVYWLGYERERGQFHGITAEETRYTFGARLGGRICQGGADFDVEAAFQLGSHGPRDVKSAMFGGQIGYLLSDVRANPRIYTGLDFGSGDSDPTDANLGTFNQLFPLGHAYLGFIDMVGRQNIIDWNGGIAFAPVPKFTVRADGHSFWRHRRNDALYNPGGAVVRSGDLGDSKHVGVELDFTVSRPVNRYFVVAGGYCHFFAGSFLEDSGSSDGIDFAFLMLQLTF